MGCCASKCRPQPQCCVPVMPTNPCGPYGNPYGGSPYGYGQLY